MEVCKWQSSIYIFVNLLLLNKNSRTNYRFVRLFILFLSANGYLSKEIITGEANGMKFSFEALREAAPILYVE